MVEMLRGWRGESCNPWRVGDIKMYRIYYGYLGMHISYKVNLLYCCGLIMEFFQLLKWYWRSCINRCLN